MTELSTEVPFAKQLRRYARALSGDPAVARSLFAGLLRAPELGRPGAPSGRVEIYRLATRLWNGPLVCFLSSVPEAIGSANPKPLEQRRIARMPPRPRQAYLLTSMEGFSNGEAARILEVAETEVCDLVSSAVAAAAAEAPASVLIIEDEYLVARDINRIVCGLGHRVIGQPRTHAAALTAMEAQQADLVIADVHLADGSSGVDTANDILSSFGEVPIIFITAFSDELLNGPRPGPTVLITKPFTVREVRAAVSQVLFFGLTSSARPTAPLLAPKPVVTFAD